jgi:hypothetical protein
MGESNILEKNGYILLSNVLSKEEIEFGISCIDGDKADYKKKKHFIEKIFLPKTPFEDPVYVKFRVSNNTNSMDASTFHGDIYNHTKSEYMPIYTCLCYFDDAQLEIIPGSHRYNNSGWSLESYSKKEVLQVRRGDILVFHANMHHRGIKYNESPNRRLLQVFDVFPDRQTYNEHFPKLRIVKTSDSWMVKNILNPMMIEMAKYPVIIDTATFFHYMMMYNDVHYKMALIDISPSDKKDHYISYEPGKRIHVEDCPHKHDLNVNVVCDKTATVIPNGCYYLGCYIIYWIVSLFALYLFFRTKIVTQFISKLFKPKSKTKTNQKSKPKTK